jgi:3-methylfumaryl-CoA hydratase
MADALDIERLRGWIGRREQHSDVISAAPAMLMAATLDRDDPVPQPGDVLAPPWHWLYFLPAAPMSRVGPDGHPARGGFLPPVPLPRRMWAAGRLGLHQPLRIGEAVQRTSEIADVQFKQGKTGALVFVKVRHAVTRGDGIACITEEQDIVYRDDPRPGAPAAPTQNAPADAVWTRELTPDPVLLFRFSALTFNGHRIHYDRPYATGIEGYPGLVVHGPLIATLLLDHLRRVVDEHRPGRRIASFDFRAQRPAFDGSPLRLCAAPLDADNAVHLWAQDASGALCMDARARLA